MTVSLEESGICENIPPRILNTVDWKTIRSEFIRRRGARTQAEIAGAGKLRQNAISKLESNDNLGPAVGTFVNAVEGLGIRVSEFFAAIEGLSKPVGLPHSLLLAASTEAAIHDTPARPTPEGTFRASNREELLERSVLALSELVAQIRADRTELIAQVIALRADAATGSHRPHAATRPSTTELRRAREESRRESSTEHHPPTRRTKHR